MSTQPRDRRSVAGRRLAHLAILLVTLAIGGVVVVVVAAGTGLIQRSSCTAQERAAFGQFRQFDGRFHQPAWDYEESRCWAEFGVPGRGTPVARYYQRRLLSHGWTISRPIHPLAPGNWGLTATRGSVSYEVRVVGSGVGIFVHQDTPLYPFVT